MALALRIIGWAFIVIGAIAVYGAKFYLNRKDPEFDIEKSPDYSYKKLAIFKFGGFLLTIVGIVIVLILR